VIDTLGHSGHQDEGDRLQFEAVTRILVETLTEETRCV
jgi:hypothetical protein